IHCTLAPLAARGWGRVGSVASDAPFPALSERPPLLSFYFRQRFAQVTNPPIDPIRERVVMSLALLLGPVGNVLDESPEHGRRIRLEHPVLDRETMTAIGSLDEAPFRTVTLPASFVAADGPSALEPALNALCQAAERAAQGGATILVVSDRPSAPEIAPIPSALALSAVHHHLIRQRLRSGVSLIVETGDAREVSHIALL